MALDVRIILPNNLRSGYLQSDFIASGLAYTTNKFSYDPDLNTNKNQIVLSFELRDTQTREIVQMKRIKTLYLSNDPYFEPSSTITINDWPNLSTEFSNQYDYVWNINSNYFFDNTESKGSEGSSVSGTGLFKINNWALSANGGLSVVYLKAVIEGPGSEYASYPNGFGIYDTIFWEGVIPTSPSNLNFSTDKDGWVGKYTKGWFSSSSSFSQENTDGIGSYLLSLYEISSTGNTPDIKSTYSSTIYRSLCSGTSIAGTGSTSYSFYRAGSATSYLGANYSVGTAIGLTSYKNSQGAYFYSRSKLLNTSSKPDFAAQASFGVTYSSIGSTSSFFIELYDSPGNQTNSDQVVLRVDLPIRSNPTAHLYTINNQTESVTIQSTSLPNSLSSKLLNGGLLELYYSAVGSSHAYVEGYFTPTLNDNSQSYLLANTILTGFGTTYVGSGFGYQIDGIANHNSVTLNELLISQGSHKLSVDLGDCSIDDTNDLATPLVDIVNTWTTDQNIEYGILQLIPDGFNTPHTVNASYIEVQKIDANNEFVFPAIQEIQLFKPSLSKNCSFEIKVRHRTDDFYVAFSQKSSYRPHTKNGFVINWDNPIAYRCLEEITDNPSDAPSILIRFSKEKNSITVYTRREDNTIVKHTLRTYKPDDTFDRYIIELSDQSPSIVKGLSNSLSSSGTWLYLKTITGQKINLLGHVFLNFKLPLNSNGLGYYSACGFIKSPYNNSSSTTYNRIYEVLFKGISSSLYDNKDEFNQFKKFDVSIEGLSNNKHYLGQKLLSGNTDFVEFYYKNPISTASVIEISACTIGENISIDNIASLTVDGVLLASLSLDSYVLVKDQTNILENGVYKKTGTSTYELQTIAYDTPLKVINGNVNNKSYFYKTQVTKNNIITDRFLSASYFCQISINEITPFISSFRPTLFEYKINYLTVDDHFDTSDFNLRFFQDTNNVPDYDNPLTSWISSSDLYTETSFTYAPLNNLVQVKMNQVANESPEISPGDKIWVLITAPINTSFGKAQGTEPNIFYIENGKFTFYKLAKNLWHKLYMYHDTKENNSTHGNHQHLRLRAKSHGKLESNATDIIGPNKIDIQGPNDNGENPFIENVNESNTRSVSITISAEDNDSGIMSFRVGREIDNFRFEYTPWMPWSQFTKADVNTYTIYLYGNLNYFSSGAGNTFMELQNIGFSGARKVWVQLMDYVGNVSETYPLTFASQAWTLVDTDPPFGNVKFYDPKTFNETSATNLYYPIAKLNSDDLVSGIKDFRYRKITDNGPEEWSEWETMSSYKKLDFSNSSDGMKKVEFMFRDFGNNATQPENLWEIVARPEK